MLTSNLAFQMWIMVRTKSDDRQQNLLTFRYAHADVEDVYSAVVEVASLHGNEAAPSSALAFATRRALEHPERSAELTSLDIPSRNASASPRNFHRVTLASFGSCSIRRWRLDPHVEAR